MKLRIIAWALVIFLVSAGPLIARGAEEARETGFTQGRIDFVEGFVQVNDSPAAGKALERFGSILGTHGNVSLHPQPPAQCLQFSRFIVNDKDSHLVFNLFLESGSVRVSTLHRFFLQKPGQIRQAAGIGFLCKHYQYVTFFYRQKRPRFPRAVPSGGLPV